MWWLCASQGCGLRLLCNCDLAQGYLVLTGGGFPPRQGVRGLCLVCVCVLALVLNVSCSPWLPSPEYSPHILLFCLLLSLAVTFRFSSPLSSALVVGWFLGHGGTCGPCLKTEPPMEGLGRVGGVEALDHFLERGLSLGLRHGGLRGVVVRVMGCAGEEFRESVEALLSSRPTRPARRPQTATQLAKAGLGPPGEGGEGVRVLGLGGRQQGPWAAAAGSAGGGNAWAPRGAGPAGVGVPLVGRGRGV